MEMIHYHGTPITPRSVLYQLTGRHFCVSAADPRDVETCHAIGQSVMLDNGAFTYWKRGTPNEWSRFYRWVEPWLDYHTTWAVIPDIIDGTESSNNELMMEASKILSHRMNQLAPVWHVHESIDRLYMLMARFPRVCFGSSGEYASISTARWNNRMNEVFNSICKGSGRPPVWIHMLRGMSLCGSIYPFASVDSTDIARNHEQVPGAALRMAERWDARQCPGLWKPQPISQELALCLPE